MSRMRGHAHSDILYGCLGVSLLISIGYFYVWEARVQFPGDRASVALELSSVVAAVAVVTAALSRHAFSNWSAAAKGVAMLSVVLLILELSLVGRLCVGAAAYEARNLAAPGHHYLYRNSFNVENFAIDLKQEHVYGWPAIDLRTMRLFLETEQQRTAITYDGTRGSAPAAVDPASQVRVAP